MKLELAKEWFEKNIPHDNTEVGAGLPAQGIGKQSGTGEIVVHSIDPLDKHDLAKLPFAYKAGNNPCDDTSYYCCDYCGCELHGKEVGYVAAGTQYADSEDARCPNCWEENSVHRLKEEFNDDDSPEFF